jgi:LuxR family maltose regulon positive regulatory protein
MRQVAEPELTSPVPPGLGLASEPLLYSKLVAPVPTRHFVPRSRLVELVRRGVQGPLTVVSAPAGSGKTALLSGWLALEEHEGPVAWQTLDRGDERPGVFWAYAVESLRRAGADPGDIALPSRADVVDRAFLTRVAWCLEHQPDPMVMVIDASDRTPDFREGIDLAYLLRNAGSGLRVVLLTRSDPSLPLHRYRLDGGLTEIRADDLAFTPGEARRLFAASGLTLSREQTGALVERTAGWAAGLKFAALSLSHKADVEGAIRSFTGSGAAVSAYLVQEVLDAQPEDARDVLLRTSLTGDVRPGLTEALTGRPDGERILGQLAERNPFVHALPDLPGAYRYQPLFHEFLRAQLELEKPDLVPSLHLRAATWLASRGELSLAIRHAVAAGAWTEAAELLVGDLLVGSLVIGDDTVAGPLVALPRDVDGAAPAIVRAAHAARHGETARCLEETSRARAALATQGGSPQCDLSISLLEAHCHGLRSEVEPGLLAVRSAQDALHSTTLDWVVTRPEIVVLLRLARARLYLWTGELESASELLADASEAAGSPGCEALRSTCLGLLALVEALSGRLSVASRHLQDSDLATRDEDVHVGDPYVAALAAHAWVEGERLHLKAALGWATEAARVATGRDAVSRAVVALVRARVLRAQGELRDASRVLAAARRERPEGRMPAWLDRRLVAAEAGVVIAEGRPDRAASMLERAEGPLDVEAAAVLRLARIAARIPQAVDSAPLAGDDGLMGAGETDLATVDGEVTAALVEAARGEARGDHRVALAALERSLALAEPELLRRPFAEMAPTVRRLFRTSPDIAVRNLWLDAKSDLAADGHRAPAVDAVASPGVVDGLACGQQLVEPLTVKELEVLGHLAELLGTEEIASSMFISTNTVRTHVRNILRKLGCTRRNDAVRRAWELGLLRAAADK